jgi:hypothetical protein
MMHACKNKNKNCFIKKTKTKKLINLIIIKCDSFVSLTILIDTHT